MPTVEQINAIKDMLHELAPWAAVAIAAIGAWQANRAKEWGKLAVTHSEAAAVKADAAAVKADVAAIKADENQQKLDVIHTTINGRMEQLVSASAEAARAEGIAQGVQEEKQRNIQEAA